MARLTAWDMYPFILVTLTTSLRGLLDFPRRELDGARATPERGDVSEPEECQMAGSWTAERFPRFEAAIRRLTEQHRELVDEPLHLAVSYLPAMRDQQHIYLFEVIGDPGESINPERDLFEAVFATSPGFPMGPNEQLHLILTNTRELEIALREGWSLAAEVVNAIRDGDYEILYKDEVGERVLNELEAEARRPEAVRG